MTLEVATLMRLLLYMHPARYLCKVSVKTSSLAGQYHELQPGIEQQHKMALLVSIEHLPIVRLT